MSSRASLLRQELEDNSISSYFPGITDSEAVIEELDRLLATRVHEGRTIPSGFVVVGNPRSLQCSGSQAWTAVSRDVAEKICNGASSFAIFAGGKYSGVLLIDEPAINEWHLVRLAGQLSAILCVTDMKAVTRLVSGNGTVAMHRNRKWSIKLPIGRIKSRVTSSVPQADWRILEKILQFCYHRLSPLGVGATLVWCLREPKRDVWGQMRPQLDLSSLSASIVEGQWADPLVSLLAQTDGAAILAPSGELMGAGSHLKCSERSEDLIAPAAGTRHTSGRRFSYDFPQTVVFVVSSDGPVTVFSDGASIADLDVRPAYESAVSLTKLVPEKQDDISHETQVLTCRKCGKTLVIEEIVIVGWKDRERVDCPVCGSAAYSSMCFQVDARVVKCLD